MKRPKNRTTSGQERLSMVIKLFRQRVGRAFTLDELADWAIETKLYPVPKRGGSTRADVVAWESRYDQVAAELAAEQAARSPLSEQRHA